MWVSFNWAEQMDLEAALEQQQTLQEVVEISQLVIKTCVLEKTVDEWPGKMLAGRRYCTRVRSGSLSLGWPSTA